MNKFLIVLMAVCLVSVHAFVKRDAPSAADVQAKLDAAGAKAAEVGTSVKDTATKAFDEASKTVSSFKSAVEEKFSR